MLVFNRTAVLNATDKTASRFAHLFANVIISFFFSIHLFQYFDFSILVEQMPWANFVFIAFVIQTFKIKY